MLVYHTPPNP